MHGSYVDRPAQCHYSRSSGVRFQLVVTAAPTLPMRHVEQSDGIFGEERENKTRDVVALLVQGKMAGVEQVDCGIRQIELERLRTGATNEGSFRPPDHQNRGLVLSNHACCVVG